MIDVNIIIKRLDTPFIYETHVSNKCTAGAYRETYNVDAFLSRIKHQVLEVHSQGLGYLTPDDWDNSFIILGKGQSRRTSNAILKRMTWEQFLEYYNKIIAGCDNNDH